MSDFNEELAQRIVDGLHEGDSTQNVIRIRDAITEAYGQQPLTEGTLRDTLGEGFHTAFRKAAYGRDAHQIWTLIKNMDREDWGAVLSFVAWGTAYGLGLPKGEDWTGNPPEPFVLRVRRSELGDAYHNAPHRQADGGSQHTGVEAVAAYVAHAMGISLEVVQLGQGPVLYPVGVEVETAEPV